MSFCAHMDTFQTRLHAWRSIQDELSDNQYTLYKAVFSLGSASDQDLCGYLHWPINCVTPRRNELVGLGYITQDGTKMGRCGRPVAVWRTC